MATTLTIPAAFEVLPLSATLDGSQGINRAVGKPAQISATNDLEAIHSWLARFVDTKTTFDTYRKEAERLYLWAVFQLGKPLSSLSHEDFLVYQRFLSDPQPLDRWVASTRKKYARGDPRWRPFYGPLSPSSQRQAMIILNVLFSWLVEAGYLAGNPLSLSRHRARRAKPRVTRYLDRGLWQEVTAYIEGLPKESDRERDHYFRIRWLFTLLYLGGLRISEVVENSMGDFFSRRDRDGEERWWLEVMGKGAKERLVPATQEMMIELTRYRREKGLPPYPESGEKTPLVLPIGKSHEPLTRGALHVIVKRVFMGAADRLRQRGDDYAARAKLLADASAHWLRHTAGSHMADKAIDLRLVRDNLGHESLTTTSQYLHMDDERRHQETEEKHRIDW